MSTMFGDMAVQAMITFLNEAVETFSTPGTGVTYTKESLLTGFAGRIFPYDRPPKISGEYIIVNHLPFVHRDAVEEGTVNVNIHVPRLSSHVANSRRLSLLAQELVELFDPRGTYLDGKAYYKFYADSRPIEENDGTYFINLKFIVTYNNLDHKQIWQRQTTDPAEPMV